MSRTGCGEWLLQHVHRGEDLLQRIVGEAKGDKAMLVDRFFFGNHPEEFFEMLLVACVEDLKSACTNLERVLSRRTATVSPDRVLFLALDNYGRPFWFSW